MNPMIREHDMATNEVTDREMTDKEYADIQAGRLSDAKAVQAAADTKASAIAKLTSATYIPLNAAEAATVVI